MTKNEEIKSQFKTSVFEVKLTKGKEEKVYIKILSHHPRTHFSSYSIVFLDGQIHGLNEKENGWRKTKKAMSFKNWCRNKYMKFNCGSIRQPQHRCVEQAVCQCYYEWLCLLFIIYYYYYIIIIIITYEVCRRFLYSYLILWYSDIFIYFIFYSFFTLGGTHLFCLLMRCSNTCFIFFNVFRLQFVTNTETN